MANDCKVTTDKLKKHVRESFEQIQKALEIREKLLLRQIDVLASQQQQQNQQQLQQDQTTTATTVPIDQMKFIAENEDTLLSTIRSFGKFNANNLNFSSDGFAAEDYIQPNDDHELMYKCFGGQQQDAEDDGIVVDFSSNKAIIEENANILNESIVNLTLNESRELIEQFQPKTKAKDLIKSVPVPVDMLMDDANENDDNNNVEEQEPIKPIFNSHNKKQLKPKLRLHSCAGTINLKNISNVTINANCRSLAKKQHCRKDPPDSFSVETDDDYTSYNCEFYKRLMNEIRNTFTKQQNEHIPICKKNRSPESVVDDDESPTNVTNTTVTTTTVNTTSTTTTTTTSQSTSSKSSNCDFTNNNNTDNRKAFFKNLQKTFQKLNIPPMVGPSDDNNDDGGDCLHHHHLHQNNNNATHPVQIEEWLKQIFLDTEIEPMQNVEILEHSNLTSNSCTPP